VDLASHPPEGPTVGHLKDLYEKQENKKLEYLSFHGFKCEDTMPLRNQHLKDGDLFVGRKSLVIHDSHCDLTTAIDDVYDYMTIVQILSKYRELGRRHLQVDVGVDSKPKLPSILVYEGQSLNLVQTVYQYNIEDKSTLEFTNPPFIVSVKLTQDRTDSADSGANRLEIEIEDHWTIQRVKDQISKKLKEQGRESLLDGDKLSFKEDELDEKKEVFRYQIAPLSELLLTKEDVTQIHTKYICADCGSEVRLKKNDAVMCRDCGYHIVYKKRTMLPCQYLAR